MSASNYLENALAEHIFRAGTPLPQPTELHVALFTTMPDEDDVGGVEPTAASYERVQYGPGASYWAAPVAGDGRVLNSFSITFPAPTEDWGEIAGFGIYDEADNLWFADSLAAPKDVLAGNPAPEFNPGALTVIIG